MIPRAYYNEIDPYAAQWLRNLIAAGHIAPGDVDERSIMEVKPDDLRRYRQCHFFAGIGLWSHALRLAGWPDDRPVFSGSCPCQPFSQAGKQCGYEDERHLWPAFFALIRECRPGTVFGEQVAGAAGYAWWDCVAADLESEGYAAAAADIGAHSIGAPHIRQRLYWVAHAERWPTERQRLNMEGSTRGAESEAQERQRIWDELGPSGHALAMAHARSTRTRRDTGTALGAQTGGGSSWREDGLRCSDDAFACGTVGSVADRNDAGLEINGLEPARRQRATVERSGALDSPWSALEWLPCSDGKARPTQPGIFPLAHGSSSRLGKLRAYGNAIVAPLAAAFIQATL